MRSNQYDNLPLSVEALKGKIQSENEKNNAFQKANVNDGDFTKTIDSFAAACVETSGHAKQVYEQFKALKSDYKNNVINLARYKASLKPLHELLVGMGQKVQIHGFPASEIAKELQEVGY